MVVIAQCHIQRRSGAELFEKSKEMRQTFRHVDQVSGDENPIRPKFFHGFDDAIMPRMISVQVQIREMDCATTGKELMWMSENGNVMIGQTPFPMWNETECPIERFAQAGADERTQAVRP